MTSARHELELLAPAKNADFGIAAIDHGADAVYIGGPAFGARANAGNSIDDIERLVRHAHRFGARVFVALNTILRDDELDEAAASSGRSTRLAPMR
jgi:collagenase-like PrtC family protease